MSKNLQNCLNKLKFIASVKNDALRKRILETMSDECLYKALSEIATNYNKGNIKLNAKNKRKLKKFDKIMKRISNKNNKNSLKKRLILQSGGFLPFIIPAVASLIGSLIN